MRVSCGHAQRLAGEVSVCTVPGEQTDAHPDNSVGCFRWRIFRPMRSGVRPLRRDARRLSHQGSLENPQPAWHYSPEKHEPLQKMRTDGATTKARWHFMIPAQFVDGQQSPTKADGLKLRWNQMEEPAATNRSDFSHLTTSAGGETADAPLITHPSM